eukprot:1869614-Prymnesium_polylepis.1
MQWQDWRSGGRDLGSATWRGTLVGVRVRLVAGGEKRGSGYGEAEGCAEASAVVFAQLMQRIAAAR